MPGTILAQCLGRGALLLALCWCFHAGAQTTPQTPFVLWPDPTPVPFSTPLSPVELNARAFAGPPVPVPLAAAYNVLGISTADVPYNTGGYDGSSWAYSAEELGRDLTWQGIVFPLGPPDRPDAVSGATIAIPPGSFGSLLVAGSLVNNATPAAGTFVLHYTDGSSGVVTQELSDWVNPRNRPGEAIVRCMPTRHNDDGSTDLNSVCVYGYSLPVDSTRTLDSVTLPATRNIVVLSLVALPPEVAGTFTYKPGGGVVLPSGTASLGVTFAPAAPSLFTGAQAGSSLIVQPSVPPLLPSILWPVPAPVLPGDVLSKTQLNASASAPLGPVPVALPFRINALYPDGAVFYERGFDGSSTAFSSTLLGPSLRYAGFVFPLGSPSVPDAASSATVALPPGSYRTLYLLGAGASGPQLAQPFTVSYTDGSSTTASLDLSSWRQPEQFAGETLVASAGYANLSTGGQTAGSFSVYGYQLPVDPARVPATLTLPDNVNVVLLAAALGTGDSFPVPGDFTYTPPPGTAIQVFTTLHTAFQPLDSIDFQPAQASVPLVVGDLDFSLSAPAGHTLTATIGEAASLVFEVAPLNNHYAGPVSFSLLGDLPARATYSFSPGTLDAGAGPQTVVLLIQTRKLSGSAAWVLVLFLTPLAFRRRFRLAPALAALVLLGGCGSGYHDTLYPLTLVATDGHFRHTLPVMLHIEASRQ